MRISGLGTYLGLFADWREHPGQARDLSVTTTTHFTRKKLRVGSALQALALLGAGFTISAALTAPASAQDYTNVTASGRVVSVNGGRSEEHTSELQSLMRISYAVFCLKKKTKSTAIIHT